MKSMTNHTAVKNNHSFLNFFVLAAVALALSAMPAVSFGQVKKAERLIDEGRNDAAAKVLKRDFFGKKPDPKSGYLLAQCYYRMHDYDEAREVMELIQEQFENSPEKTRFYIDVLIAVEDFGEAYLNAARLISQDQSDPRSYLWFNKVADLAAWDTLETGTKLENIAGINTPYNEYAPHAAADGSLWFVTDINSMQAIFPASYSGQNIHLIYKTVFNEERGEVKKPSMLVKNRKYYDHDGPLSPWPGTPLHAVTMRDIDAPVETSQLGIYFIDLKKGEEPLPFRFNQSYNTGHPAFDETGTRMYFTSDRPGGNGGMDIWYCDRVDDQWAFPVNLGSAVNTPGNEVFPHYREGRLFFSSDRRDMGYGGLDIYYASEMLKFRQVTNLRHPINSARDDFSIALADYNRGFLASNRREGAGGDDIYRMEYYPDRIVHEKRSARFVGRDIKAGTLVTITDGRGKKAKEVYVDTEGIISLAGLTSAEVYTLDLLGVDTEGLALQVLNDDGSVADTYERSADGSLRVELLRPEDYSAGQMDEDDIYEMAFDLKGKVVSDDDTEDYSEASVTLKSGEGVTLGKMKTDEDGEFAFEGLYQGRKYTIETEGIDGIHEIDIIGDTGELVQTIAPVGSNSFSYTRAVPAADWMRAEEVEVPEVYAAVVSETAVMPADVILEHDSGDKTAEMDEDGFIRLEGLKSKNAYSLTLSEGSLEPSDRLVLLGAYGDTSQTVRPFDERSFRFEYMLYDNFGAVDEKPRKVTPPPAPAADMYRGQISDFGLSEATPMRLTDLDGTRVDTVYVNANGALNMTKLKPKTRYDLRLLADTLAPQSRLMVSHPNGELLSESDRDGNDGFVFIFASDTEEPKAEEAEEEIATLTLSGQSVSSEVSKPLAVKVYDPEENFLTEGFTTKDGSFNFRDIPAFDRYIMEFPDHLPEELFADVPERDGLVEGVKLDTAKYMVDLTGPLVSSDAIAEAPDERREFTVPHIYYRFNSYYLMDESRRSLDMLTRYMRQNPDVIIEIRSYTDSRGSAEYNILLSKRRANSVKEYLTGKNISENRMKTRGLGESVLVNECTDGVKCTEEQHAVNRRTTFVILEE